jgi:peroxiredoxin
LTLPVRRTAATIEDSKSAEGIKRMALKVGDVAPDFEVPAVTGKDKSKLKLSDFRGKQNVVIAFYPLDWTPV